MAIRFRGALNDFSQLEYGYCPPEAVPIKEGDNLENVIMQALRQALPLFILTGALAVVRLAKGLNWTGEFSFVYMLVVMLLWSVLYFALIVLHELIHAVFFPRRATKDVWLYQLQAAMVYCNTPVTKRRFIVMSLTPAVLLGFILFDASSVCDAWGTIRALFGGGGLPLASAEAVYQLRSCAVLLAVAAIGATPLPSMAWSMIFGGIGDFYNVRNVLEQVPKDAYVFNYGIHTYWIEDPRKKK